MKKSFSHLSKIDILKYILLNELKFLYLLRSIQLARVRDYTWWQNYRTAPYFIMHSVLG